MPLYRFPLIPAQTGGERLRKVYYPFGVSGEGIPRPFNLYRGPCNTHLGNLKGR